MTFGTSGAILRKSQFHFVGIGGIGMCGLAELLHNMGAKVTGSDISENANTQHLRSLGLPIFKGHKAEQLGVADVVVYSSAIRPDNPEVVAARERKIPLIPRAEALAEIMRLHRGVAVAGTHGKTTTTSMAAAIFLEAGAQPTIVVGGRLDLIQSTALLGTGEWLIAEADESDGSFSKLSPEIAIITNVDSDHLDHFQSFENLQTAFRAFAGRVPFYGAVIACGDDPILRKLLADFPKQVLFYGFGSQNDFILSGANGSYTWQGPGGTHGDFTLQVPGRHNALNAAAAILAGLRAGFSVETCARGLARFQGVDRRFHRKGEKNGVLIYDDYGHHPTEVRATLQAFREKFPRQAIRVLFQPHRYSRTQLCWNDFLTCFELADQVWLTDIYAAGESPIPGISASHLVDAIQARQVGLRIHYLPRQEKLSDEIVAALHPGDVFVTLGAGDVWKVGMEILT